ncbi:glutaredoxin domain protein [Pseudozyma hubeiensis SY62]|uniref:Glutaredoxin-like protein n=1 Tax=Pseudozyma hubeiensis (strain SY62) TaxID=1305764 RepID=R9PEP1_PSEHS|nr:glutaredoxin domain protein [Pseudozyma hubeiensis SY62]GAC96580.1 glutaredoxin domain protein [Pseudozyma hubeiensis SY62]
MYTGTDCQLCQVMQQQITKASEELPIQLSTYNIRDDSLPDVHAWRRKYQYDIPVLHLNDKEIFRHRVTAQQLIQRLQQESEDANGNSQ